MKPLHWSEEHKKKIILRDLLKDKIDELKKERKKIVSLNGSFDLLHAGHLQIIFEASQQGDVLIVALNTDRSIKEYKSPLRPIIPLEYRLQMMSALQFVDYVTYFDETDPRNILNIIQPDIHVNGPEYGLNCVEAEVVKSHGGKIHIAQFVPGLSTSEVIKKIKSLTDS
jgi:rfaE bifunctional protein nucleotidyltransferase chain/domain